MGKPDMKMRMTRLMLVAVVATIGLVAYAETWTTNNVTYTYTVVGGEACIGTGAQSAAASTSKSVVEIPSTLGEAQYPVTSVGDYAFYECTGLTSVTIPDSVTSIGDYTFHNCSGLKNVTIPSSVSSIGTSAFGWCSGLTSVTIPENLTIIERFAFVHCSGLTSVTIPDGVTSINANAFYYCGGLTNVTIPNSVTNIGSGAFINCTSLTSVTIPSSVTSIGDMAFGWSSGLTSVTMCGNAPTVGNSAFGSIGNNAVVRLPRAASGYVVENNKWQGMTVELYEPVFTVDKNGAPTSWAFNYTGAVQTFTVPATGYYMLECYGAQGGNSYTGRGGNGGFSQLACRLTQGDVLYVYVGGQGGSIANHTGHPEGGNGGWNGGGKGGAGARRNNKDYSGGGGGGGATHIASSAIGAITSSTSFTANHANLLLIAGGGGGGLSYSSTFAGGAGGGATGEKGSHTGEPWSIDWNNGTLSCGKDGMPSTNAGHSAEGCGGGGGGYQGGNTWTVSANTTHQCYTGAGGSSWGDTTKGKDYSTVTGGAWAGGNGKAEILLLVSQDEIDAHVGKVIGADGKMYKTVSAAQNAGTTASGVIAYWGWAGSVESGNSTYRGIVISLADLKITWGTCPGHMYYCTSQNHQCSDATSFCSDVQAALNARNGIAATSSAYSRNGEYNYHDAACVAYDYGTARPAGASKWAIPSVGQWQLIAQGLTGNSSSLSAEDNPDYHFNNLSTKINAAGGTYLGWLFYWSSTEQDSSHAWCFNIGGTEGGRNGSRISSFNKGTNDEYMHTRAFFAFADATDAIYTISYNANGGSGVPSSQTKDGGIDLTLSGVAPTRAGYLFKGWNTEADGSGTSYASGATFTGNVDTTLYAQWGGYGAWAEENSVTGAWDEEDASGVPNAFRYVFDQPEGEFDAVSGVDVVGSSVTMITPAVVNTEGFTISYALDKVSKAGEVIEEGTPSASAEGLAINYASIVSNAYFKVAVVLESSGGTESRTKMDSEATIGVLAITNAPATAIIGVPWVALSGGGAISVSNLVYTANLTAGDKLQAFDDNGSLQAWTLNGGVWTADYIAGDNEQELSDDADTVKLARGKGVWLTRQDPTAPIYLVGQVCTNKVETALEKPTEPGAKVWNLVASPKVEPVDVAQLLDGRQATDKVMVPTKGAPKNFIYMGGKWGYIDYETDENGLVHAKFVTDDTTVPAGTGLWYLNGDMSNEKIDW